MQPKKNLFQIIINTVSWFFIAAFVIGFFITAISNFNVIGGYKSLIVQSGSMEPTIMTGDVIIVAQASSYRQNEVITFYDIDGYLTTHRIFEIVSGSSPRYVTKGDANRVQDNNEVSLTQIIGKVILTIPKLGYFIGFTRSKIGLIIFILVPAALIIIDEVIRIIKTAQKK